MNVSPRFSSLLQNKTLLFQFSALAVLALAIIVIGFTLLRPTSSPLKEVVSTTPTPVVSGEFSTSPKDGFGAVSIYGPISISFPSSLTQEQQKQVSVIASPPILADRQWESDINTLNLIPQTALKENQKYSLSIASPVGSHKFTFTTTSAKKTTEQTIKNADLTNQEIATKYPWYDDLPLFTGKYFVTFDLEKEQFTAKLFVSKPEQTEVLKALVTQKLRTMGVNLDTYKLIWEIEQ